MFTRFRLFAFALALTASAAAVVPPTSEAAPGYKIRPCAAPPKTLRNAVPLAAAQPTRYYCSMVPVVSYNYQAPPWAATGKHWIEMRGQLIVDHGSKQIISYQWTLTKRDYKGKYSLPVAHGSGACGKPVTRCNIGTWPYADKGGGTYQFYLTVNFTKERGYRYTRAVQFQVYPNDQIIN